MDPAGKVAAKQLAVEFLAGNPEKRFISGSHGAGKPFRWRRVGIEKSIAGKVAFVPLRVLHDGDDIRPFEVNPVERQVLRVEANFKALKSHGRDSIRLNEIMSIKNHAALRSG